ncbi:MAG: aldo/keto reductase [Spirochaetes bacterium]|nr:aldo/keto reductase [Spirochaetota bacterium]
MQYRVLEKLGYKISALSFGAMRLPTSFALAVDKKKAVATIRKAVELGINYFDTAYIYHLGASEKVLGEALGNGVRKNVYIADKLPMILMRKTEDFDRFLETQLERLGTDYIDFYLFHNLNQGYFDKLLALGLFEKMEQAKKRGLIRHIGFSFHDTLPVFKKIVDAYPWDLAQIQYNYLDTAMQATTEGLHYAAKKKIPVAVMEGLKGGMLADPPKEAKDIMRSAASKKTPVEWAFQFLWNLPEVATVLSGMGSPAMVEENCGYAERSGVGILSGSDMETIEKLVSTYRKKILVDCTACRYCMPCPYGVNIPDNFAMLNNANGRGGIIGWLLLRRYKKFAVRPDKVNKEDPDGAASLCTKCGVCVKKCPQSINIPEELTRVDMVMGRGKRISDVFQR